jgi:hypothetical protein
VGIGDARNERDMFWEPRGIGAFGDRGYRFAYGSIRRFRSTTLFASTELETKHNTSFNLWTAIFV